jgi:hypothetical protein
MSVSLDSTVITEIADNTCSTQLHIDLTCFPRHDLDDLKHPISDYLDLLQTAFKTNRTVQSLSFNLHYDDIGCITPKLAATLLIILPLCPSITHLNLQRCHLGLAFACALAKLLSTHHTLRHLDLEDNDLSDVGGVALAESLKMNTSLSYLNLDYNQLSDITALAIATALKYNHTLGRIDFGYHDLDSRSLKLRRTPADGHNTITETGAKAFLALLAAHHTLQNIHFNSEVPLALYNEIKQKISKKIQTKLQEALNPYLHKEPMQLIFSYTKHAYCLEQTDLQTKKQKCNP